MPRKRHQLARSSNELSPFIVAKAKRMAQRLRDHHGTGQRANESTASTREFAAQAGMNENTLRKMKAFARVYTRQDLQDLCRGRRPNGLPLHWGYIAFLLAAQGKGGKEARLRFQQQAIKNGWTVTEMCLAIRQAYGNSGGHGRKLRPLTDLDAELKRLVQDAQTLASRATALAEAAKARSRSDLANFAGCFKEQLREVVTSLERDSRPKSKLGTREGRNS